MRISIAVASAVACTLFVHCTDDVTRYVGPRELAIERMSAPDAGKALGACDASPSADCGVSFARDIHGGLFVRLACMTASCHGPGAFAPKLDANDPKATHATLAAIAIEGDGPNPIPRSYVDTCARDAAASGIMCNLQRTCGSPMPQGAPATQADIALVARWLACGAPDN